ncbi:MAG: carbohydrate ABC transporter permease [Anaerolineae bacterium]
MASQINNLNTAGTGQKRGKLIKTETLVAFLFLLPSLIGFIAFFAVPAVRGFWISLTDWDLLTDPEWVGLDNYRQLVSDREFRNSLWVTVKYVLWNIPLQTAFAVVIAVMMDRLTKSMVIRALLIVPWLMPNVIVAMLWLWLMDPGLGLINSVWEGMGFAGWGFLGNVDQALPSIAVINIWRHVGYTALLIFAGLQTIPDSIYEAAAIDGATELRAFWHVTIPLLRPVLAFVLITSLIGSFQIFDTVAVTTGGGPINATEVINMLIFERAFERFDMGYATTVANALFIMLVGVSLIQLRLFNADDSDI